MKRLLPAGLAVLFLVAGVATEGPACASLAKGQQSCCQNCPLKMLPKLGDSCCKQGLGKGSIGIAFQQTVKKTSPAIASCFIKDDPTLAHALIVSVSSPRKIFSIYLIEEHLLI